MPQVERAERSEASGVGPGAANRSEGRSLLERVRTYAATHPYEAVGVAALAGAVLSTRGGRTVAGWAVVRVGWDVLLAVLRTDPQPGERAPS